jgi:hypothetical protein
MEIQSAILGNVATSRQYTPQDGQELTKALKLLGEKGFDIFSPNSQRNSDLLLEFFEKNPHLPVNVSNIFKAVEGRKSDFAWLTDAQRKWYQAAQENPQLANDLVNSLAQSSGRPGSFVKDGDPLFENLLTLFKEINGRGESVTAQSIISAQDRIQHQPGKGRLHFVPQPRKEMGAITEAARNDGANTADWHAGKSFLGSDMVPDGRGGLRSKTPAEQKAEREAEEATANPQAQEHLSPEDQQWMRMAQEACRFGTHSQQESIRKAYDQGIDNGLSWRKIFDACNEIVKQFKRAAAVRGWGR